LLGVFIVFFYSTSRSAALRSRSFLCLYLIFNTKS
jgi:hypothetical protein